MTLEDFLTGLDLNNLEKDMLFSDLEDDEESKQGNSNENGNPDNELSNSNPK